MGHYSIIARPPSEIIDGGISMSRYFVFRDFKHNDIIEISGEDAHHIIKVLRHKIGDKIEISNGQDLESTVVIENIDYKGLKVVSRVIKIRKREDIKPKITLFQGMPKGNKIDFILQKNTEIGVTAFIPIFTERTIVQLSEKKAKKRLSRWRKIVIEASKQCRRIDIPMVHFPINFAKAVDSFNDFDLVLMPWEEEKNVTLKQVLRNFEGPKEKIAVLIGPEGGFSSNEVDLAMQYDAIPVTLGSRILRTETAGIVVSSLLMYELGDLGG